MLAIVILQGIKLVKHWLQKRIGTHRLAPNPGLGGARAESYSQETHRNFQLLLQIAGKQVVLLDHKSKWTASAAEGFAQAALYAGEV
jgi:hypothetical protein